MEGYINYFNTYIEYVNSDGKTYSIAKNNSQQDYECWKLRVPVYGYKYLIDNDLKGWEAEVVDWLDGMVHGHCDYQAKRIRISNTCLWLLNWGQVKSILLHEVAHALCPNHYHDEIWKAKAIELGSDGLELGTATIRTLAENLNFYKVDFK